MIEAETDMTNYRIFMDNVLKYYKEYLPEEHKDKLFGKTSVGDVDYLKIITPIGEDIATYPFEALFAQYSKDYDFDSIMNEIIKKTFVPAPVFTQTEQESGDKQLEEERQYVKDHVVIQLLNAEKNKELLSKVPHAIMDDIAIIYRTYKNAGSRGFILTDEKIKKLGFTENELNEFAAENMSKLLPYSFISYRDRELAVMQYQTGLNDRQMGKIGEVVEKKLSQELKDLYFIESKTGDYAAGYMLFNDVLAEIGEKIGSDFFIMPRNTDQLIIMADTGRYPIDYLENQLVRLEPFETLLSTNIYHYKRSRKTISLQSTNTQTRRDFSYAPKKGKSR